MKKAFVALIAVFVLLVAAMAIAGNIAEPLGADSSEASMRAASSADAGMVASLTNPDMRVLVWRDSVRDSVAVDRLHQLAPSLAAVSHQPDHTRLTGTFADKSARLALARYTSPARAVPRPCRT